MAAKFNAASLYRDVPGPAPRSHSLERWRCTPLPRAAPSRGSGQASRGGFGELLAARALEHARHRVHGRGDTHGALHRFALEAVLPQLPLVRGYAAAAAVDRGHREREQLEIRLGDARIADDAHAQP